MAGVTARREDRAVREARRPRWLLTIPEIRMMDRLRQLHNLDLDIRAGTHQILGDYIRFDLPYPAGGLANSGDGIRLKLYFKPRSNDTTQVEIWMPRGYLDDHNLLDRIADFISYLYKLPLHVRDGKVELKGVEWRYREELEEIMKEKLKQQHNLDLNVRAEYGHSGSMEISFSFTVPSLHDWRIDFYFERYFKIYIRSLPRNITQITIIIPSKYLHDQNTLDLIAGLATSLYRLLSTVPAVERR